MSLSWKIHGAYHIVHGFGRNDAVGSTLEPISIGGIYRTPQVSGATQLRVKAGDANDAFNGSGAQEIALEGLDQNGDEVIETVVTNGVSPSLPTSATFVRLYKAWVSKSGTYADTSTGSHTASIVIENNAGTEDWVTIEGVDYAVGQSQIGCYTIPSLYVGYIPSISVSTDAKRSTDISLFIRRNALQSSGPFEAIRLQSSVRAQVAGQFFLNPETPYGPYLPGTDLIFMAKESAGESPSGLAVDFEIVLQDEVLNAGR